MSRNLTGPPLVGNHITALNLTHTRVKIDLGAIAGAATLRLRQAQVQKTYWGVITDGDSLATQPLGCQ